MGRSGASRKPRSPGSTAGLFNPVHPYAVQVLGEAGAAWLAEQPPSARAALPRQLARRGMRRLVVARGTRLARDAEWAAAGIEVARDRRRAHEVVYALRRAALAAAPGTLVHGVLMRVHGTGVLIEGRAGAGKGALALELLGRGHALVADDAVELRHPAPGVIVGHGPRVLRGYLETRGLGVLDVRRMHGRGALRPSVRVSLVVRLGARRQLSAAQRLGGRRGLRRILGEPLPVLSLAPERPGDNLAALVEAACLDQRLRDEGLDAAGALGRRQARAMRKKGSDHFLPAVRQSGGLPSGK